ncbi:dienelactone hydrolase [Caulobacter sp. Root1455]|uniref:dienelactone hydrolase family protein n=1 Tax=unclassified Caulobacter TaxID=2648921 RepID=UPI0006F2B3CF|nr:MULTISPECIES: dienelactone hydrolase family protein [unclassified Caulobacter]KQY29354.1 dienelactone hydrolase [Caulobacter sp. Root487D2Y]KQY96059.1 dienelactone hydrolase [Caulobacter sp. Root1455]
MAQTTTLTSALDGFSFTAAHAEPEGERRGGIVVVQEIFGLDQYVLADVARWSALGFEVLAPSLFDRAAPGYAADHEPAAFPIGIGHVQTIGLDKMLSDIQACIDALAARGPVFAVGYCLGGSLVWLAAGKLKGLAAGAAYYGSMIAANAELPLNAPVIVHLGRKDGHIPAEAVKAKLAAAHPEVPVHIYENSGHGFNNDGRPDSDLEDAKLARRRSLDLFAAHGAA